MIEPYWIDVAGPPRGPGTALRAAAVASLRAAWRVRVRGRENVPTSGPVILASNHTSVLDGPLLVAMTGRRVNALAKHEMFDGILGAGFRALGQIPVNRDVYDPAAVKASLAVLERGDVLAVYPEGTRGDGQFDTIKPGVAYFALCTGAPIVPVATLGSRDLSQPRESAAPLRSRIDIVFGPPIATDSVGFPRRQLLVRAYAVDLHSRLREHVLRAQEITERMPAPHERLQFGG